MINIVVSQFDEILNLLGEDIDGASAYGKIVSVAYKEIHTGKWVLHFGNGEELKVENVVLSECRYYISKTVVDTAIKNNENKSATTIYGRLVDYNIPREALQSEISGKKYEPIVFNPYKVSELIKYSSRPSFYDDPAFDTKSSRKDAHTRLKARGWYSPRPSGAVTSMFLKANGLGGGALNKSAGVCSRLALLDNDLAADMESNIYMLGARSVNNNELSIIKRKFSGWMMKFMKEYNR